MRFSVRAIAGTLLTLVAAGVGGCAAQNDPHLVSLDLYCTSMALSPNGQLLAVMSEAHGESHYAPSALDVFDARTGRRLWWVKDPGFAGAVAFSPDNTILATTGREGIVLYAAATGRRMQVLAEPKRSWSSLFFCPDGQSLIAVDTGNALLLWNLATGKTREARLDAPVGLQWNYKQRVVLSSTGSMLAICGKGEVRLWNTDTWTLQATLPTAVDEPTSLRFSPDDSLLFCGGANRSDMKDPARPSFAAEVFDVASRKSVHTFPSVTDHAAFTADGKWLIYSEGSLACVREARTGTMLGSVTTGQDMSFGLGLSATGGRLAVAGRPTQGGRTTIVLWDVDKLLREALAHCADARHP